MRASQFFVSTLKEAPAEAELVSHRLMLRAGLIKKLGSGLYTWMPMGLRVLRKVEAIVRDEMNRAGAIELLMPLINPAELWQETDRWDKYGPNMLRIKDRHDRDFLFAPTHEEVITDIVRKEIVSYKQLPKNFYHMTDKFRDEVRPRFGVMRAREFMMKDAYSFDLDKDGLMRSYRIMFDAYTKVFTRLGLRFRPVEADNGEIGGASSHEFQVLADSGEDVIAWCPSSDYAANIEKAEALAPDGPRAMSSQPMQKVPTPGKKTCEDVAALLGIPLSQTVKAVMVVSEAEGDGADAVSGAGSGSASNTAPGSAAPGSARDPAFRMILVRGDHSVNEVKAGKIPALKKMRPATPEEIAAHLGSEPGYCGPVPAVGSGQFPKPVIVIADRTVAAMTDFDTDEGLAHFEQVLTKMGVDKALQERGAHEGDTVRISEFEFDYS